MLDKEKPFAFPNGIEHENAHLDKDDGNTLVGLLAMRSQRTPAGVALSHKRDGAWAELTWGQVLEEVKVLSAGLVAVGLQPGDRVAIFAGTSAQWILCDFAVSAAGGITVPIYASSTPDECQYLLNHSESVLIFVDNDEKDARQAGRLSRLRQKLTECPSVRQVVVFDGAGIDDQEMTLEEFRQRGEAAHQASPAAFDARLGQVEPDDVCSIIYTSGTTGEPKGVMLTHGSYFYTARSLERIQLMLPPDALIMFLPLAHVFGQMLKAGWVTIGYKLIIAESPEKLLANVAESQPTILPSVPRVFEKIYNTVLASGGGAAGTKGKLFRWAMAQFDRYFEARRAGRRHRSLSFELAKRLVFTKVAEGLRKKLGGRIRLFLSGGAPLPQKIAYFFDMIGFKILEGYGLTECTAAGTSNRPDDVHLGTVGRPSPGTELRLAYDGEILLRGPGLMKGYYKNPAATAEALDPDGWLHTGDIGELDANGCLRITDRKKDIIVTSGGKKLAPQKLENMLKGFPLISQALVHGDKRSYLTALLCVSEEQARQLLAKRGVTSGDYADLSRRPEIRQAVQQVVDQVNAELPPYSTLKKFVVLDHDLTQESGALTPTLKVKRKVCNERYETLLNDLYDERSIQ